jgi:hypothetical protein
MVYNGIYPQELLHKTSFSIATAVQYQQIFNNAVNFIEEWGMSSYRVA